MFGPKEKSAPSLDNGELISKPIGPGLVSRCPVPADYDDATLKKITDALQALPPDNILHKIMQDYGETERATTCVCASNARPSRGRLTQTRSVLMLGNMRRLHPARCGEPEEFASTPKAQCSVRIAFWFAVRRAVSAASDREAVTSTAPEMPVGCRLVIRIGCLDNASTSPMCSTRARSPSRKSTA